ncbi:MAG TPA: HAMP domain-containing sensor histidine kinase [Anaerovoracaceae bacterium]|nr:HAMP domain-containing sensor histidine kinase [Anaerovoracaceae bacterium]
MKNRSIRARMTLYYSVVLILITIVVFGTFLITIDLQTTNVSRSNLTSAVQSAFDSIEYTNTLIEVDNDFDGYYKGVQRLVYSESGSLIIGSLPSEFPSATALTNDTFKEIEGVSETWLVYDLYNVYPNGQAIWIRGITTLDNGVATIKSIRTVMVIVLPILLLLAIIAGRRITNRAFDPVANIIRSAESISGGSDMSKRLPLYDNKDELYYLTDTLNQMMDRLQAAFESEKQFSSDVSHELKTPISVILAECEYMLAENRSADEYKDAIETIQQQSKRTMGLISQLLQLSRTFGTDKILSKEDIDLSLLCESVVSSLAKSASAKGITLKHNIEDDVNINADESLIMRMILNLVSNGIKYGREDGFVKLSLFKDVDRIIIKVADNGIGIAESDQENIFNRFYKVDKSRKADENSYGLGLAMVKWIAEAHGGTVSLESELGKGSTFTVRL